MGAARRGIRLLASLSLVAAVAAAACTRDAPRRSPSPEPQADPRLHGTVLVAGGFSPGSPAGGLGVVDVATGTERRIDIPTTYSILGGVLRADGSVVGLLGDAAGRLRPYEVSADAAPRPVGPALRAGPFLELATAADVVLISDCDRSGTGYTLDLQAPSAWRPVAAYCGATLSPDGSTIASTPDGRTIVTSPADRESRPRTLVRIPDLRELPLGVRDAPSIVSRLTWGEAGLGAVIGAGSRLAVVTVDDAGRVRVTGIGDSAAGFRSVLSWRPGGDRLAVASETHTESVVRELSPDGSTSVLSLVEEPVSRLVWSPSGDVLLVASVFDWVYVDAEGRWLRRVPVSRNRGEPVAWVG